LLRQPFERGRVAHFRPRFYHSSLVDQAKAFFSLLATGFRPDPPSGQSRIVPNGKDGRVGFNNGGRWGRLVFGRGQERKPFLRQTVQKSRPNVIRKCFERIHPAFSTVAAAGNSTVRPRFAVRAIERSAKVNSQCFRNSMDGVSVHLRVSSRDDSRRAHRKRSWPRFKAFEIVF
jgi:hypothetical protein